MVSLTLLSSKLSASQLIWAVQCDSPAATFEGQNWGSLNVKAGFDTRNPHAKESIIIEGMAACYERFEEWKSRWTSTPIGETLCSK